MADERDPRIGEALDRRAAGFDPRGTLDRVHERARGRHRTRRITAGAVALSTFAAVVGGFWLATRGTEPAPEPTLPADVPVTVDVGGTPFDIAVGEKAVWVGVHTGTAGDLDDADTSIVHLDPATGEIEWEMRLGSIGSIAAGDGGPLWATGLAEQSLMKFDPGTHELIDTFDLPDLRFEVSEGDAAFLPSQVEVGFGRVWVASAKGAILSLDPETGEVLTEYGEPGLVFGELAVGEGAVWVSVDLSPPEVWRIDPVSGQVTDRIEVGQPVASLEAGPAGLWLSHEARFTEQPMGAVSRIDPDTLEVGSPIAAGITPGFIAVGSHALFSGDPSGRVLAIDPRGVGEAREVFDAGVFICAIDLYGDTLWVAADDGTVTRIPAADAEPDPDATVEPTTEPTVEPTAEPTRTPPVEGDVVMCDFPAWRPTYLPWLESGAEAPDPSMSRNADGGGPQGLDPGYSILGWSFGDISTEGGPELEGGFHMWRSTQSVGAIPPDDSVPPLPDGSLGKVYGPGEGGEDYAFIYVDPFPSPYDDGCSETLIGLTMTNVPIERVLDELTAVAQSLEPHDWMAAWPPRFSSEAFALWPEDTPEEAVREAGYLVTAPPDVFRASAEETALAFVREILAWPDPVLLITHPLKAPPEPATSMLFQFLREPGGPRADVKVTQSVGDRWWVVTGVSSPGFVVEVGLEPGAAVLSFDRQGADLVQGRLGYGTSDLVEHVEEATGDSTRLRFRLSPFDWSHPGHALVLFFDADGQVFGAWGIPLPPATGVAPQPVD